MALKINNQGSFRDVDEITGILSLTDYLRNELTCEAAMYANYLDDKWTLLLKVRDQTYTLDINPLHPSHDDINSLVCEIKLANSL